jgi:hypothetical protein
MDGIEMAKQRIPRYIVSLPCTDGKFEKGFNKHFKLEKPLGEAVRELLRAIRADEPGRWYMDDRSELEIRLVDCEIKDIRLYLPID